jgi:general secretion pathway protein L
VPLLSGEDARDIVVLNMASESPEDKEKHRSTIAKLLPDITTSILEIPEDRVLRRKVSLPLQTEEKLGDVLGFEMGRLTPFEQDQVYFDFHITERNKASQVVNLNLSVVRRKTIDQALDRLEEYGVTPAVLSVAAKDKRHHEIDGAGTTVNLLPSERRGKSASRKHHIPSALAVLAAVLTIVAAALPLMHQTALQDELDSKIAVVRAEAQAAGQTGDEIASVITQGNFFSTKRAQQPTVAQILDEVTRLLPDDTWLARFELSKSKISLHGESKSASSLISLVEASTMFSDTRFASPVTKNPRTSNDRFMLEAQIESEVEGQQ